MSLTRTISALPLFVVLAALAVGCGGTDPDLNVDPQKRELGAIDEIYRLHMKNHQRPPAALADLKQYVTIHPIALRILREGKYLVVWGMNSEDAGTVLAYEKDAPTNGGWALMADGTVKRLDAQAFQSVPKAKG